MNVVWKFRHVLIFNSTRVYRTFKTTGMFKKRFSKHRERLKERTNFKQKVATRKKFQLSFAKGLGQEVAGRKRYQEGNEGIFFFS